MMNSDENVANPKDEKDIANNDSTDKSDDTLGENTGDSALEKGNEPNVQNKPDDTRVPTVTPDNDNGDPGPSTEKPSSNKGQEPSDSPTSNKGQGPSGENL